MSESVTVAVHSDADDVNVVSKPVQQSAGQLSDSIEPPRDLRGVNAVDLITVSAVASSSLVCFGLTRFCLVRARRVS